MKLSELLERIQMAAIGLQAALDEFNRACAALDTHEVMDSIVVHPSSKADIDKLMLFPPHPKGLRFVFDGGVGDTIEPPPNPDGPTENQG